MAEFLWCAGAGAAVCGYVIWRRTSAGRMLSVAGSGPASGSASGSVSLGERLIYCSVWSLIGATTGAMFWAGVVFLSWLFGFVSAL
jgi:hypothetical protein